MLLRNCKLLATNIVVCFLLIWILCGQPGRNGLHILPEQLPFEIGMRQKYRPYDWSQPLKDDNLTCMDSHSSLKAKFKICPHSPTVNKSDVVSNKIRSHILYEPFISKGIENFHIKYPQSTFVDIGVNVGTHALYAAALGMHAVGLEPLPDNWNNIHKSVLLNKFQTSFDLLPYAVSDERKTLEMVANLDNFGASHIVGGRRVEVAPGAKRSAPFEIQTMLLEDLLPFIKTKTALLKIDIESYECHVIGKSNNFFSRFQVPMIFMETAHLSLSEPECVKGMINFLSDIGYKHVKNAENGRNIITPVWNANATAFTHFPWPRNAVWSLK